MTDEPSDAGDPWVGKTLTGYTILEKIAEGGMGVVYLGRHTSLDRLAAIKFLAADLVQNKAYIEMFLREARAAAKLNHPNVVTVYDAGSVGVDTYYFIMEYVAGRDLGNILEELGRISPCDAVEYARQAAMALAFAHKKNIIHRDIKPENLLLTDEGIIKVGDLGLAKWVGDDGTMTQGGWVLGSPFYISPERLRDSHDIDRRTDIYSLGATLYHLVAGRVPHDGPPPVVMSKHLMEPLPDPRQFEPNLDEDLWTILQHMMAKDREERYSSMEEVETVLAGYLAEEAHPATRPEPESTGRRIETPASGPAEQDLAQAPATRPLGRKIRFDLHSWIMPVAVLLVVLILAWFWPVTPDGAPDTSKPGTRSTQVPRPASVRPPPNAPANEAATRTIVTPAQTVVDQTAETPQPELAMVEATTEPPVVAKPDGSIAGSRTIVVSPDGQPDGAGTAESPLRSIRSAIGRVRPGETILVREGVYRETVDLSVSGEKGRPIRLKAEGRVQIDPGRGLSRRFTAIEANRAAWWEIEGLELTNYENGIALFDAHDVSFRKFKIHTGRSGVLISGKSGRRLLFEDIEIFKNEDGGLDVTREVSLEDVIFRRCSSHHNHCNNDTDGFGISHSCEVRNVRFEYCESSFNGHDGFDFGGKTPGGIRVEGCLAHHNGMQNFGSNFKCQNPGMILINCVAWATGQAADPNFEVAAEDIRLIHCTSGRNEDAGVVVSRKNAEVFNCIIANAKGVALRVEQSASELRVENTIVHECAKPGGVSLGEHGNRQADPAFIDAPAGNFRIAAGSAAAGQGKAQNEASTDADGRPRPKSPSIGAYEPGD